MFQISESRHYSAVRISGESDNDILFDSTLWSSNPFKLDGDPVVLSILSFAVMPGNVSK